MNKNLRINNQGFYRSDEVFYLNEDNSLKYLDEKIIDPFWPEVYTISKRYFRTYMIDNYNLTNYQIWNLLNGIEMNHKEKCYNPLCINYVDIDPNHFYRGPRLYCSQYCKGQHHMNTIHSDPSYDEMFKEAQKLGGSEQLKNYNNWQWNSTSKEAILHREKMKLIQYENLNSYISVAKSNRTNFLNKGNPEDECYLYIALVNSYYKFGVTNNIYNGFHSDFKIIHRLKISTRLHVANLEYYLSLEFKSEWFKLNEFKLFKIKYKELLQLNLENLTDVE